MRAYEFILENGCIITVYATSYAEAAKIARGDDKQEVNFMKIYTFALEDGTTLQIMAENYGEAIEKARAIINHK